jgi:DnaJ homolog subfamily A member 5
VYSIKKAYRRKALELHPDRNYGQVEDATKLFTEIQCAYEVLSDPQERAWYDTHQYAEIADDGPAQGQQAATTGGFRMTSAHILSLVLNFNPHSMEFSDSPSGFFGGLREVFEQIAQDEGIASRWDDSGAPAVDYPSFGSKDDSFDDVVRPFYAVWTSFSTRKSFSWKDKYKYSEAPDRRVRRLMEKENKKMREDGMREYNDAVRSLVAFVKKRDPRYKINIQTEAERQSKLRESAAAQAARSRAANQAKMQEHVLPEWARTAADGETQEAEALWSSEESEVELFECVVCNKTFKSSKQFDAHERSKKHVKAVKQLRREMLIEDDELDLDDIGQRPEEKEDDEIFTPADEPDEPAVEESEEPRSVTEESPNNYEPAVEESEETRSVTDESPNHDEPKAAISSPSASEEDPDYIDREHIAEAPPAAADDDEIKPKLGKAKQKKAKKLAAQAKQANQNECAQCYAVFTSRTQLFTHLRETGHAQAVPVQSKQKKKAKSKK